MPNNCSDLIQRKQNVLHKLLRSRSERKSLNVVTETTSNLRISVERRPLDRSPSSNHLQPDSAGSSPTRRTNLFTTNRIQPTNAHIYEKHLPLIRDISGTSLHQHRLYDDGYPRSRSKTPIGGTSPKSAQRSLSASISSIFNTLSKRSQENVMGSNGDINELKITSSRRSRQLSNDSSKFGVDTNHTTTTTKKITVTPQKHTGDDGIDNRPGTSRQQRSSMQSARPRLNMPNVQVESPLMHELLTKEQTNTGSLYQRRTNNSVRSPIKHKIDKYRRRSEETTQAITGNTNTGNVGVSTTTLTLGSPSSIRSKPQPSPTSIRRVTSDAEIPTRHDNIRTSMESNVIHADHPRVKSVHIHATHQELVPPATTTHTTSASQRRNPPIPLATAVQQRPSTNNVKHRQQRLSSAKQTAGTSQGNLYLAFIASRHLSTLEDTPECDIDHPRLIQIFTWLKNVEKHRHEQADHDALIIEQDQRMLDQEEDFSLYSEIQHAVDDVPANTTGEPCERIATMAFED
ncbi:unnamed protein product [Adineta steineri]|uniref:Uncharacterized protein n=2 Tax=Adineta steineri TaxID=433720 RepID=A0A815NRM6_9BILA|nr:unnamed protein product [Adineta steineri]